MADDRKEKLFGSRRMSLHRATSIAEIRRNKPKRTRSMQFTKRESFSTSTSLNNTMTEKNSVSSSSSSSSSLSSIEELVPVCQPVPQVQADTECIWLIVFAESFYESDTLFEELQQIYETTMLFSIRCGIYLIYSPDQSEVPLIGVLKKQKHHRTHWRPLHTTFCCLDKEDDYSRTATITSAFKEILFSTPNYVYSKTSVVLVMGNKPSLAMKNSLGNWLTERHSRTLLLNDVADIHTQIKDLVIKRMKKQKKQKRKRRKPRNKLKGP